MAKYRTREGDVLDSICLKYYGDSKRFVEAVLEANPLLPRNDPVLPSNLIIELPDLPELTAQPSTVKLWS